MTNATIEQIDEARTKLREAALGKARGERCGSGLKGQGCAWWRAATGLAGVLGDVVPPEVVVTASTDKKSLRKKPHPLTGFGRSQSGPRAD